MGHNKFINNFALIELGIACFCGALWYAFPEVKGWPILLVIVVILVRRIFHQSCNPPILGILIFIFLLTAGVGIWAAYDKDSAWIKFWIIVGSIFIFFAITHQSRKNVWGLITILSGIITFLATYYLLTNDWNANPADLSILNQLGSNWMIIRPDSNLTPIHPNFAGGLIAIFMPFSFALTIYSGQKKYWGKFLLATIASGIALIGLIFTSSRAAWLALGLAIIISSTWFVSRDYIRKLSVNNKCLLGLGLMLLCTIGLLAALKKPDNLGFLVKILPGPNSLSSRVEIYTNTLRLINDFPFTGGGLGAFPGLYSQYILHIPLFFFGYSHNLYLDIWLEQSFMGLTAYLLIFFIGIALILSKGDKNLLDWATLSGFIVIFLHGFVDDPLYGNLGTPLLFIHPGIAIAYSMSKDQILESFLTDRKLNFGIAACFCFSLLLIIYFTLPLNSYWDSNLGALQMAHIELSEFPTGQWNNGQNIADYAHVKQLFNTSISNGPSNKTSHYRLGLIEMLEREFDRAIYHLEIAYYLDPRHRGVRKSLGYCYVWTGKFEQADAILSGLPEVEDELSEYISWWQIQGRQDLSKRSASMLEYLMR